jgi:2-oxoglutarate ferredoxin oxidoreductase subunit alpha
MFFERRAIVSEGVSRPTGHDVSIVLGGEAGQGIQTIQYVLTRVLKRAGYHVFATSEFMSRIRGGSNSTQIRVSSERVSAFVDRIDILIPLDKDAIPHLENRISPRTIILGEKERLATGREMIDIPFGKIATAIGSAIFANTVAVGVILGLLKVAPEALDAYLAEVFADKTQDIIQKNIEAGRKGHEIGLGLSASGQVSLDIQPDPQAKGELLLSGAEAVAMGAIAGGCNFIAAYPMSPSTAVFTYLSQHAQDFGIVAEQAEDEISAMNMVIGAWYAGARGLANTSGGGFALMAEALSLAGMLETPVVVHIAQRPGPATGLPTRTEQGDLLFALHAGHGEFPRIILAPGTLEDAFYLTQKAFNLADKFQSPVFVLTDQYFIDSSYNTPAFDLSRTQIEKHIVKTDRDYMRYKLTADGLSPRGVPGFGEGVVVLDSDEHTEEGHITEDLDLRTRMVDKRLRKLEAIAQEAIPPVLIGNTEYTTLVIGWGATYSVIVEALKELGRSDVAFLHFGQVYPLHPDTAGYLRRARETVIVEGNATAQFGQLIRTCTGIDVGGHILKYNGLPFTTEEVVDRLKRTVA